MPFLIGNGLCPPRCSRQCRGASPCHVLRNRHLDVPSDHPPPHFHAQYGDDVAQIEFATLRILNGSLPPRALRLVRAWARLHTEELADNWARAQELEPLAPIEPLP
jgi:hypothetical protein